MTLRALLARLLTLPIARADATACRAANQTHMPLDEEDQ